LGLTSSTKDVILDCINNGFTMFDGASIYSGQYNLRDVIHENNILRSNLFIMSKLWLDEYGKNRLYDTHDWGNECIETNTRKLINKLNCDYIDCLFIHWPLKLDEDFITDEFIIPEIWIQMENLVNKGLIKHIGLSNFGILEIQSILNICKIKPYINQVEINLYNNNNDIIQFCKKNNIKTMAHSSFRLNQCMNEPLLNELEEKYGFSKYAIIINWLFSKGVIPIISSSKIENLQNMLYLND
jgi:diketogulonate reductase-like aldo/keto reductase